MSAKRRVASVGSSEPLTHGSKRRRVSGGESSDIETPQTTTEAGLKLMAHIRQSTDKNGRLIATNFIQLPDKRRHADYYKVITLPISLETVEVSFASVSVQILQPKLTSNPKQDKLKKHGYDNLSAVEGDLKRMVTNAKRYNDKNSVIFADAERIRKMLSNTMPKINPAYKDPKYTAVPTPLPEEVEALENGNHADSGVEANQEEEDHVSTQASQAVEGDQQEEGFEGDSIQQAQDKILSEMIHLKDPEGQEVGSPFVNKPDKVLYKDYYDFIQHPVSLRSLLKQVRGIEGRKPHSHKTAFPTWQSFVDEVDYIWGNAREFNEDDSEIVTFANYLETYFQRRVAEAKLVVPDMPQDSAGDDNPRIKLKISSSRTPDPSQKLTLKFPGQRLSSVEDKTQASDSESLQGQKDASPARGLRRSMGASPGSAMRYSTPSHHIANASPLNSGLPTSHDETRRNANVAPESTSQSLQQPLPSAAPGSFPQSRASDSWPNATRPVNNGFELIRRKAGQGISDALIKNMTIKLHPSLELPSNFRLSLPASALVRQQSFVVSLPASHNFLSLALQIAGSTAERRTRLIALAGPHRAPLAPQSHSASTEPVYDIKLSPGLTKIDFQIASQRSTDQDTTPAQEAKKEFERLTVFFRLLH
ncbi:Protein polybromo-1 [Talaromyces islandicus]|uniref:Protein polybromo-1 n=1 Tax=Talaromyces islandicus TaxID=28573 RepID=A0A0U1MAV4_TALIS|nr:Protein polybromo-1 [Talaromyces islandicus]